MPRLVTFLALAMLVPPATVCAATAPGATGPDAQAEPPVRATVVEQPVPGAVGPPDDSDAVPTRVAIVLENAYLRATIVPALGGRVVRLVHKPTGRHILAGGEETGGGAAFHFPRPESDLPPGDPDVSYRVIERPCGDVTVAMDRRFQQCAGPTAEHYSPLRLAALVTLRPESPVLEITGRIDNRLPVRYGFRLWYAARFPRERGASALLPAARVADAGLADVRLWPGPQAPAPEPPTEPETAGPLYGLGVAGDWAGIYDPHADANHLVLRPRHTGRGAMVDATGVGQGGDARVAVGSNVSPAHPGHFLQPFGAYVMPVRLAMVTGIGPVVWADEWMAVGMEQRSASTTLRLVGMQAPWLGRLVVRAGDQTDTMAVELRPDRPTVIRLRGRPERIRLTFMDAENEEVTTVTVPPAVKPLSDERLDALRDEIEPWTPMAMEVAGRHPPNGREGVSAAAKPLVEAGLKGDIAPLLAAARVFLRTEPPGSTRWQQVRGRLAFLASRGPHAADAHAAVALMLTMEAGGRCTETAGRHLEDTGHAMAGYYLGALSALATGNMIPGLRGLRRCAEQTPVIAMGLGDRALPGNERLHPAALQGAHWPRLLRAAVRLEIKQPGRAISVLDHLLREDPSRPEAVALLADAHARLAKKESPEAADHARQAQALREEADRLFEMNPRARRDLDALFEEARLGRWAGIPRP